MRLRVVNPHPRWQEAPTHLPSILWNRVRKLCDMKVSEERPEERGIETEERGIETEQTVTREAARAKERIATTCHHDHGTEPPTASSLISPRVCNSRWEAKRAALISSSPDPKRCAWPRMLGSIGIHHHKHDRSI